MLVESANSATLIIIMHTLIMVYPLPGPPVPSSPHLLLGFSVYVYVCERACVCVCTFVCACVCVCAYVRACLCV